jgi:hypothetical protein
MRFTLVFEVKWNIMDHFKVGCTPTYKLEVIIPKEGYFYVELNSFLGRPQGFSSLFIFIIFPLGIISATYTMVLRTGRVNSVAFY